MTTERFTRRDFAARAAILIPGLGLLPYLRRSNGAHPAQDDGITHGHDAIHQETVFAATPGRVYAVLTDAALFDKVVKLSAAMKSGLPPGGPPTAIRATPGGAFTLFAGFITGRQLELIPSQRLVQAWRSASWPAGAYSIARFELHAEGTGCRLVFDHTGFPAGEAKHLADGWRGNYWQPMAHVLA